MLCQALRNVPKAKLKIAIEELGQKSNNIDVQKLSRLKEAYHRYFEANIPIKYWYLDFEKDFTGDPVLTDYYKKCTNDIVSYYKNNNPLCFSSNFGLGKTFLTTGILKKAVIKGFSGLYVSLSDIASAIKSSESFLARKELLTVDFLVVDEFDPRYVSSDLAADFYGKLVEEVVRHRSQNNLPLLMCTNSPNILSMFSGTIKQSLESIFNYVEIVPVLGTDFRKKEKV
jgi:DNA replication protein DnaC